MGVTSSPPSLWRALLVVADALAVQPRRCWYLQGTYHFRLEDTPWGDGTEGCTIALSAESAGRIRVESCHDGAVRASMWTRADDLHRLSQVVTELAMTRLDAAFAAE